MNAASQSVVIGQEADRIVVQQAGGNEAAAVADLCHRDQPSESSVCTQIKSL